MKKILFVCFMLILVTSVFAQGYPTIAISDKNRVESDDLRHIVALSSTSIYDAYYTFTTANGSAKAGSDYVAESNKQVKIPAGFTIRHAIVDVTDDNSYEPDETLIVTITSAWLDSAGVKNIPIVITNAVATGTINDDDSPPTIEILDRSFHGVLEDDPMNMPMVVKISDPTAWDVHFTLSTSDNTALVSDNDYVPVVNAPGMIKGDLGRQYGRVVVDMVADTYFENDELFNGHIMSAYLDDGKKTPLKITKKDGLFKIANDDAMPIVGFKKPEFSKKEGNPCKPNKPYVTANLVVVLDKPATGWEMVTVHLRTNPAYRHPDIVWASQGLPDPDIDDTMDGWDDKDVAVMFAKDETQKKVPVKIFRDCMIEEDEWQQFILLYEKYVKVDPAMKVGTLMIKNDDCLPVADFAASAVEGIDPFCVEFINKSTCAGKFLWDFGDGTTSTLENPKHCFRNPPHKYYDVTLTVYSDDCCEREDTIVKSKYITVHKQAAVAFNATPIAAVPGTEVTFMNKSAGGANKFTWKFGDGTELETQHSVMNPVHPTHVYEQAGEYGVCLKGEGHGGMDKMEVPNLIYIDEDYVALELLEGSATLDGKGWDDVIDHDIISPDANVVAINDGAYATFQFADGMLKMVNKLRIANNNVGGSHIASNLTKDFKLMVSVDGENWTEALAASIPANPGYTWDVFTVEPAVAAKYLKLMLCNARGGSAPYITMYEFQVFGKPVPDARVQVIHNAADPVADAVDVYLNGGLLLDDFAFRTAIPFTNLPALVTHEIGIAPKTSTSYADVIAKFEVVLDPGAKYVVVANGVLTPDAFAENPDGKDTAFTLFVKTMAQEEAMTAGNVEFAVLHGSTDAPTVDVYARGVAQLVDDAAYGDITAYLSVPAADYTLDITDATGTVNVVSYLAPLSGLADGAAFVFASGFFDPASNGDGPAFGVFAALPDGSVLELPVAPLPSASISNSGQVSAENADLAAVPTDFALLQNYPNPFNPETSIRYELPFDADVTINIYNINGQLIRTLMSGHINAGYHQAEWNATDQFGNQVAGGVYFYQIVVKGEDNFNVTKKMVLMK